VNDTFRAYREAAAGWLAGDADRGDPAALDALGLRDALAESTHAEQAAILAAVGAEMGKALATGPLIEAVVGEVSGLGRSADLLSAFDPLRPLVDAGGSAVSVPYARPGVTLLLEGIADDVPVIGIATVRELDLIEQIDGTTLGRLAAVPTSLEVLQRGQQALESTRHVHDLLFLTTSARLLGIADRCLGVIREHLSTRVQFGKTLASFQALQHAVVDAHIDISLAHALLDYMVEHWSTMEHRRSCAYALKAQASGAARTACRKGVQFLGAMGFTDEGPIGPCMKHALVLIARYGGEARCRMAYRMSPIDLFQ